MQCFARQSQQLTLKCYSVMMLLRHTSFTDEQRE